MCSSSQGLSTNVPLVCVGQEPNQGLGVVGFILYVGQDEDAWPG